MTDKLLVLTTAGSEQEAETIAYALVEKKLAACVNIIPKIGSVYRWEGEVEKSEEWLLLIKTVRARQDEVFAAIRELHSYKLPESISIAIEDGSKGYLDWLAENTG